MPKDENPVSTEWQLLEKISIADPGTDEFAAAVELAGAIQEPDILFAQAGRHALLPALGYFLVEAELLGVMPGPMQKSLLSALYWNRLMTDEYVAEAIRITDAFAERGLRVAVTKGIVGQASLYDGHGSRQFADLDLMILPDQRTDVAAAFVEIGYTGSKKFDFRTGGFVNLPRSESVMYRLYPDHLPHFLRVDPAARVPVFNVDVAFSLTWFGSAWQVPMDDVMSSTVRVPVGGPGSDKTVPAIDAPYFFLFTALHLFREAWFSRAIDKSDVRLSQAGDVRRSWQRLGRHRTAEITTIIEATGIAPAVAWVCHHVDQLYGTTMVQELDLGTFCDPHWLSSASGIEGEPQAWHGDFRRRLYDLGAPVRTPSTASVYATAATTS